MRQEARGTIADMPRKSPERPLHTELRDRRRTEGSLSTKRHRQNPYDPGLWNLEARRPPQVEIAPVRRIRGRGALILHEMTCFDPSPKLLRSARARASPRLRHSQHTLHPP